MTLYESTRHLHHACEQHPLGQKMARSTVNPQEWADWLAGMATLHTVIDRPLPLHLHRAHLFNADA
ncbi:hypothetical protein V6O07_08105, partial [Arthrospira platensis SPKY2]